MVPKWSLPLPKKHFGSEPPSKHLRMAPLMQFGLHEPLRTSLEAMKIPACEKEKARRPTRLH